MKKLISLILISALFILTGCIDEVEDNKADVLDTAKERGKFLVGVSSDSKPFCFLNENNKFVGLDVDIARRIAKNLLGDENAIHFVDVRYADLFTKINKGEIDFAIAAITITQQRQMVVDFSDSYFTAGQALIVRKDSDIQKIKDLNKKRIIVQLGSTSEKIPKKFAPAAILLGFKNNNLAFEALKNGQGDAMVSDDTFLKGFVADNPEFKILPFRLTVEQYGIAFKNSEDAINLKMGINNTLKEMRSDGSLDELKKKWHTD